MSAIVRGGATKVGWTVAPSSGVRPLSILGAADACGLLRFLANQTRQYNRVENQSAELTVGSAPIYHTGGSEPDLCTAQ
jgi:hypothetical protein